jgi:predicted glycosyltransferase
MNRRVLFYVQHLLGIGHLKRAAILARACAAAGLDVTIVSGGAPVDVLDMTGFALVQLPPLRAADRTFQGTTDERGQPVEAAYLDRRRALLLETLERVQPAIVLVEMFPFGRRALRAELWPLIERAKSTGAQIICSVRDILVEKIRPEREAEMIETARSLFDAVLVHGDPAFIPFDATFARAKEIAELIHYTGYVVEPLNPTGPRGTGEVIVSAGSSATGEALLRTALAARPHTSLASATWHLLAGQGLPDSVFDDLRGQAGPGVIVERARADFTTLLANCALSISQGGYNTVMEILTAGARAVLVPYAGGHETEQTLRARRLAERGLVHQIPEGELSVAALADAVEKACTDSSLRTPRIDLRGALKSAEFLASRIGLPI